VSAWLPQDAPADALCVIISISCSDLGSNKIGGTLPPSWSALTSLEFLCVRQQQGGCL